MHACGSQRTISGADSHLPPFGDRVYFDAPAAAAACITHPHLAVGVLEYMYIQIHVCCHIQLSFIFFNVGPGDGTWVADLQGYLFYPMIHLPAPAQKICQLTFPWPRTLRGSVPKQLTAPYCHAFPVLCLSSL